MRDSRTQKQNLKHGRMTETGKPPDKGHVKSLPLPGTSEQHITAGGQRVGEKGPPKTETVEIGNNVVNVVNGQTLPFFDSG